MEEEKRIYDKQLEKIKDDRNNILKMKEMELQRETITKDKKLVLNNKRSFNDTERKINRDFVKQHEDGLNKFNKFSELSKNYSNVNILKCIEKSENDINKFVSQEKMLKRKKENEKSKNKSIFEGKENLRVLKISTEHRLKKELIKTKEEIKLINR